MPPIKLTIPLPAGESLDILAVPLTSAAFAPYGDVLENPHPAVLPSALPPANLPLDAIPANQGTAIKYQHPSRPQDLYAHAPSGKLGTPVLNMFVCATRPLERTRPPPSASPSSSTSLMTSAIPASLSTTAPTISTLLPYTPTSHNAPAARAAFEVRILERHPFTAQTFVPLVPPPGCAYLVVVAPSLPPGDADEGLPAPVSSVGAKGFKQQRPHPGRGMPDLTRLQAFIATGSQAVTYGAGTWHAPMVALGPPGAAVEFVVSQFVSGVADEDCQEVEFGGGGGGSGGGGQGQEQGGGKGEGRVLVRVPDRVGGLAKL